MGNKALRKVFPVLTVILACAGIVSTSAAQEYDIDAEIARIKKEIVKAQAERKRTKQESAKDRADFEKYRERNAKRVSALVAETDSIRLLIRQSDSRNDSLEAVSSALGSRIRQQELLEQRLTEQLTAASERLIILAAKLPPLVAGQTKGSLEFLKSELKTGAVNSMEALYRMLQIIKDVDAFSGEIQVVEGVAPVSTIRGTTYRLRIGNVFEMAVDGKGQVLAIWSPSADSDTEPWKTVQDPALAQAVLKAVRIREGKALPSLVELQLMQADSAVGGGGRP